jgi:uncharacterized membrane protein YjdF
VVILRERRALCAFFGAYYLGILAIGVASGRPSTLSYAIFVGAAALIVGRLFDRVRFSSIALWGLALWGLGHMCGGLVEINGDPLYQLQLIGSGQFRVDKVVHFLGFGFATIASYEVLRARIAPEAAARSVAIAAIFCGLGFGALNEMIEFLITLLPTENSIGGFSNTGWDLVANTLGALTAGIVITTRRWLFEGRTV